MQWTAVGESEVMQNEERQIFRHPNSPNSGQFWMKKPISFKQVKITHNPASANGNVSRIAALYLKRMTIMYYFIPTGSSPHYA